MLALLTRLILTRLRIKGGGTHPPVALIGVAWNTRLVSDKDAEILKSWDGIVDPRWAGRCAILDILPGGTRLLPYYFFDKEKGLLVAFKKMPILALKVSF